MGYKEGDEHTRPAPVTDGSKRPRGRPRKVVPPGRDRALRVVRSGLHEQAAERLRRLIVDGELAPGAPLVEVDLSSALGISRTPLREALKLLAEQGLVELRANRSPRVRPLVAAETAELFEALAGIERIAAELAALRMSASGIEDLRVLQSRIEAEHERGRRETYSALNRSIHVAIVAAARNSTLSAVHGSLLARAEQVRAYALRLDDRWAESVAEHRAILLALERRDSAEAGRLLGLHVSHTAGTVAQRLVEAAGDMPSVA